MLFCLFHAEYLCAIKMLFYMFEKQTKANKYWLTIATCSFIAAVGGNHKKRPRDHSQPNIKQLNNSQFILLLTIIILSLNCLFGAAELSCALKVFIP